MKTFLQVLNENEAIFTYKGINVTFTSHGVERDMTRTPDFSKSDFEFVMEKVIDWCLANPAEAGKYQDTELLFFSKSKNQGYVLAYRRDKFNSSKQKHIYIVTVLPKGKSQPKSGTKKIVVESTQDLLEMAREIGYNGESVILID